VIDGARKPTVLLDSVASQANRMELALLEQRRRDRIELPLISVDFGEAFPDLGLMSCLETPHRVYDAILRDSLLDGEAFRASETGQQLTDANMADARAMLAHCPTALLFGAWDSTGPRGGMGNKFQRALVSEVVGVDFEAGTKVKSRIDPLQVAASVHLKIPKDNNRDWSVDPKAKSKQRPSEVNHSNVAPSRDEEAGGVTFAYGLHTAVLSLPAIRRLRFGDWSEAQVEAAHELLAALGVLTLALQQRSGYDFRSRCTLVPDEPGVLELVQADGTVEPLELSVDGARTVYGEALAAAKDAGIEWATDELRLEPMPKLVQLITASRAAQRAGKADES